MIKSNELKVFELRALSFELRALSFELRALRFGLNGCRGQKMNVVKNIIRFAVTIACAGMIYWYVASSIVTIGSVVGIAFFGIIGAAALFFDVISDWVKKCRRNKYLNILFNVLIVLLIAGVVYVAAVLGAMTYYSHRTPEPSATVVVLGCQVNGDQPSLMLSRRIEAAFDYLEEHPDAKCVLSGGKGSNERISEAQCMYDRLVKMGIDPSRLYMEDRSENTEENLRFTGEIIEKNGLNRELAIVTDGFHEMRAAFVAEKAGFSCGAVPARTPLFLAANFTTREILAVTAELFIK